MKEKEARVKFRQVGAARQNKETITCGVNVVVKPPECLFHSNWSSSPLCRLYHQYSIAIRSMWFTETWRYNLPPSPSSLPFFFLLFFPLPSLSISSLLLISSSSLPPFPSFLSPCKTIIQTLSFSPWIRRRTFFLMVIWTSRLLTLASAMSSPRGTSWTHSVAAHRMLPLSSSRGRNTTVQRWMYGAWGSSCTPSSVGPYPLMGTTSRWACDSRMTVEWLMYLLCDICFSHVTVVWLMVSHVTVIWLMTSHVTVMWLSCDLWLVMCDSSIHGTTLKSLVSSVMIC